MRASIIIPTFNRLVFTRICVQFLMASFAKAQDIEVVIVDNGSGDETPDFLRTLPAPFRIILNRTNRCFAGACNQGAELATGDNLVFLNNDTVPVEGWLDPLLESLDRPDVGIVGSKLLFPDETIQHAGVVITETSIPAHMYYLFPGHYPEANVEREYQAVTGACLAIRRSLFQYLGGFDESYRNSFEDIDLCLRARAAGKRVVYTPRSVLYHFESVSEGRHDRDDANRLRYLSLWQDSVIVDEPDRYRKDGFLTVPRIPVRTMSQALAQMQLERRRADTLEKMLVSFEWLQHPGHSANNTSRSEGTPVIIGSIPNVLTAGSEVSFETQIADLSPNRARNATLKYAWKHQGVDALLWGGEAGPVRGGRETRVGVKANVLVPSIPGEYNLEWHLITDGQSQLISRQVIAVASRYGIECRARLPESFVAGENCSITVRLKNIGAEPLLPHGGFCLSYHWFDASGNTVVDWEGYRTPILERLGHGEETLLQAKVLVPGAVGRLRFAWDAVHEGQFWFSELGSPIPHETVEVRPASSTFVGDQPEGAVAQSEDSPPRDRNDDRNASGLTAALRLREVALRTASQNLSTQKDLIEILERRIREGEARVEQMDRLIQAIQRGRIMRLLAFVERWRRQIVPGRRE